MKPHDIGCDDDLPSDLLHGRVVLVTGAGAGLGREVALACAAKGATVALLGRSPERLSATYDAITEAGGREPAAIPLDLASATDRDFDTLAGLLRKDLGGLDAIVHCAVRFRNLSPVRDQSLDDWLAGLRVNLAAPQALTRACLPLLEASADGTVVFTSETHAVAPAAYWAELAVPKAALATLVAVWADELGERGPRMHVIVPGPVASPQRGRSHPGEARAQLPPPQAVARAYLRLLGPDGRACGIGPLAVVTDRTGKSAGNGLN
jgi:NAD(P)-dependent dehydrogenase (short-subunit alcohol dehydrogenase family)